MTFGADSDTYCTGKLLYWLQKKSKRNKIDRKSTAQHEQQQMKFIYMENRQKN